VNRILYSILLYILSPLIWGYLLFRGLKAKEYREGYLQRLGYVPVSIPSGGLLLHCASVGETRAAEPLIRKLLDIYPDLPLIISTSTPTGKNIVKTLFKEKVFHCYLPIDWPGSCRRFLKAIKPKAVILMETEVWPNFLHVCSKEDYPTLLANARMSDKSLSGYLRFSTLTKSTFSKLTKVAAQYESDKSNFIRLGVANEKIVLVGNIKFDLQLDEPLKQQQKALKNAWAADRPVWLAASIHPKEFESILKVHKKLLVKFPDLLLIGVPRHPEKFAEFEQACVEHQLNSINRSDDKLPNEKTQVVVGDTMGEVLLFSGIADMTFVGGSLIERGGHNPLEPIVCGSPVVMGKHYENFKDVCQILLHKDILKVVDSTEALVGTLQNLLSSSQQLNKLSAKSLQVIQENQGCVEHLVKEIQLLIKQS